MVHRERVADNIYSFQSGNYANVNAGVIIGPDMAIVVDTLPFPEETAAMRDFIEREMQVPVRYLINTHYHADHTKTYKQAYPGGSGSPNHQPN